MTGHRGTYLDPELSVRLAILDNVDRQKIIEAIVAQMRIVSMGFQPPTPADRWKRLAERKGR